MNTPLIQADSSIETAPAAQHNWKAWLAPRPFVLVSTVLYVILLGLVFTGDCYDCGGQPWKIRLVSAVLLSLLALDRVDYWLFGEVPPARVAVALIAVRLVLAEIIALIWDPWSVMWLYALLPYTAALYLGIRASLLVGGIVWLIFVGRTTVQQLPAALLRACLTFNECAGRLTVYDDS